MYRGVDSRPREVEASPLSAAGAAPLHGILRGHTPSISSGIEMKIWS
jgi:hypothetical protein